MKRADVRLTDDGTWQLYDVETQEAIAAFAEIHGDEEPGWDWLDDRANEQGYTIFYETEL